MSFAESPPGAGHNSADPLAALRADIEQRIGAFMSGADIWNDRAEIDAALEGRANDFLTGARRLWKEADDARKAEGRPHRDAEKAVNESWAPLLARVEKTAAVIAPKLDAWLKKKQEAQGKAEQEARDRQRQAEEAARAAAADAAAAQSASARIEAEERAEAARKQAELAERQAQANAGPARAESATGLANRRSLKTVRTPRIVSLAQAVNHYKAEPELIELILKFAARDLRGAPTVRGVKRVPAIAGVVFDEEQTL